MITTCTSRVWSRDYALYHSFFNPEGEDRLCGESTPIYIYWKDAARRIWQYNPEIKIIVILRNPIDRAYSHWNMERLREAETLSFGEAIRRERERCRALSSTQHRVYSYVDRGYYLKQIKRLRSFFPEDQLLVLRHETLLHEPDELLRNISSFLDIKPFQPVQKIKEHALSYPSKMDNEDRAYLKALYFSEIKELERFLGWSL